MRNKSKFIKRKVLNNNGRLMVDIGHKDFLVLKNPYNISYEEGDRIIGIREGENLFTVVKKA